MLPFVPPLVLSVPLSYPDQSVDWMFQTPHGNNSARSSEGDGSSEKGESGWLQSYCMKRFLQLVR